MNFAQLEELWIAQGGNPAYAPLMAAIALAESTGDPTNTTGDGGTSYGLYQIHWTVHPQFNPWQLTDPAYNTQAAIQLSGNGAGLQNEGAKTPWTTLNSWILGDGGHGDQVISQYLGPYAGRLTSTSPASSSSSSSSMSTPIFGPGQSAASHAIGAATGAVAGGIQGTVNYVVANATLTFFALAFFGIGGAWLIFGNKTISTAAGKTAKVATKVAAAAA